MKETKEKKRINENAIATGCDSTACAGVINNDVLYEVDGKTFNSIDELADHLDVGSENLRQTLAETEDNDENSVLGLNLPWIVKGEEFEIDDENDVYDVIKNCEPNGAHIIDDYGNEILSGVLNVLRPKNTYEGDEGYDSHNLYEIERLVPNDDFTRLDICVGDCTANKSATFVFKDLGIIDKDMWINNIDECTEWYYPKYNQYCFGLSQLTCECSLYGINKELKERLTRIVVYVTNCWVRAHYLFTEDSFIYQYPSVFDLTDEQRSFYTDFDEIPDITITVFTD